MGVIGRAFPEHAAGSASAVDEIVLGPAGLLDHLRVRLGLGRKPTVGVIRVAAWCAKLDAASDVPRFWSASMSADPWSAAETTLAMRDELIAGGWQPGHDPAGSRVADLAAAESSGPALPPGLADDLLSCISALRTARQCVVARLELLDDPADLPPGWRELVTAMARSGTHVSARPLRQSAEDGTDLARLQRLILSGTRESLHGDGTVCIMHAETALMAAEGCAEWLVAGPKDRSSVVLASKGNGFLIDMALSRRARPILGSSCRSPFRGAIQVLQATLALLWCPFDPATLLRFLQLPILPLPPRVASLLAGALAREPGVGGSEWRRAWERIETECLCTERGATRRQRVLAQWRSWTEQARFSHEDGVPVSEAAALCERIQRWASQAVSKRPDPVFAALAVAAASLREALGARGCMRLPATQLDRMVEAAIAGGLELPGSQAEVSPTRAVPSPGSLWGQTSRLLWWDIADHGSGSGVLTWTEGERAHLSAVGCSLDTFRAESRRRMRDRSRAATSASEELLLVEARLDASGESPGNGLLTFAAPLLECASIRFAAETLLESQRSLLGRYPVTRVAGVARAAPARVAEWKVPRRLAARFKDRVETPTALEDMAACSMRWLLRHVAKLGAGGRLVVPNTERLTGNLAHAVALSAFQPGELPDPDAVRAAAVEVLERLIDRTAASLRMPEAAATLAFARVRIPESFACLATILARHRVRVVALEENREAQCGEFSLTGRVDMLVIDPEGRAGVIDLKWCSSPRLRREEIIGGRAVQLAAYVRLVSAEPTFAAYYLIRQQTLLGPEDMPLATGLLRPRAPFNETWQTLTAQRADLVRSAVAGEPFRIAYGSPDRSLTHGVSAERRAPCRHCDMRVLCRTSKREAR